MDTSDRGGVSRYIRSLLEGYRSIGAAGEFTVFFNLARSRHLPVMRAVWRELALPRNFTARVSRLPYRLRESLGLPVEIAAGACDVYHGCFDQLPVARARRVVTLHDVRYLEDLPALDPGDWLDKLRRADPSGNLESDYHNREALFRKLRKTLRETLQRADLVITVSQFSKSRLVALTGADPDKVRVVYHGVDRAAPAGALDAPGSVIARLGLAPGQYILAVSKFDPLKNQLLLVRAFARFARHAPAQLVFAGPLNWYSHVVREEVRALGLEQRVVFAGFVSDTELAGLYRGAAFCAFPSLYEGFGLPVLEAMAHGTPVVASAVCSIPEVAVEAVRYAGPGVDDWAGGLDALWSDRGLRARLAAAGRERAGQFSWQATARQTLALCESLA
jgi:glycosyltransferase involved in cell wall biosynthesis